MGELHSAPALRFKKLLEKTYTNDINVIYIYHPKLSKLSPLAVMVRYRNTDTVEKYVRVDFDETYTLGVRIDPDGSVGVDKYVHVKIQPSVIKGYISIFIQPFGNFGIAVIGHIWVKAGNVWHSTASLAVSPLMTYEFSRIKITCCSGESSDTCGSAYLNPDVILQVWGVA